MVLLTGVSSQAPHKVSVSRDQVEAAFGLTGHAVSHPTTSSWLQVSHRPTEIQGVEYQDPFLDWVTIWKSQVDERFVQLSLENTVLHTKHLSM